MILVCVTEQKACRRLIETGHKLAEKAKMPLKVICVRSPEQSRWLASDEVEDLFAAAREKDAEMIIKFSHDPVQAVSSYIDSQPIRAILTGTPPTEQPGIFIQALSRRHTDIPLIQVDTSGRCQTDMPLKTVRAVSGSWRHQTGALHDGI